MKQGISFLIAVAAFVSASAYAQFIAKSVQADDMIVGFTDVPCELEFGHKVIRSRGNWMQAGCYSEVPGAALLIHWKAADPSKEYDPSTYERVSMSTVEKTYAFRGWPKNESDLTQTPAKLQGNHK